MRKAEDIMEDAMRSRTRNATQALARGCVALLFGGAIILLQGCDSSGGGTTSKANGGAQGSGGATYTGGVTPTGGLAPSGGVVPNGGVTPTGGHCTRAGHPCMACTEKGYPDSFVPFVVR